MSIKLFQNDRGFSLLNIMATLVIIMIILGFSIQLVRHTRQTSQRLQCASNLKQIYQYLLMYLEDHKDSVPKLLDFDQGASPLNPHRFLKVELQNYLNEKYGEEHDLADIFTCPSDRVHDSLSIRVRGSYDHRDELSRSHQKFTFSEIKNPQNKIIMGDFRSGWHDHSYQNEVRINVLYADGHVEWVTEEEWQAGLQVDLFE